MAYLIAESITLFGIAIAYSTSTYAKSYYFVGIIESLVLALTSVNLSTKVLPKSLFLTRKLGPVVVATPVFCLLVIYCPWQGQIIVDKMLRITQVAMISSLALLFTTFALEKEISKYKEIAISYSALLTLLVLGAEVQVRFGIIESVRTVWPIAWLIGLSAVAWSLHKMNLYDNSVREN
jgi:hypothetical protein